MSLKPVKIMNRSRSLTCLFVVAILSSLTGKGLAQSSDSASKSDPGNKADRRQGNISFDEIDSNKDGRISQVEYVQLSSIHTAGVSVEGSRSTQDGTGGTSRPIAGGRAGSRAGAATGASSVGQQAESPAAIFRQLDHNADGYLNREEFKALKVDPPATRQP
jgi:Ca2+-binding EF-hand superfamily protein